MWIYWLLYLLPAVAALLPLRGDTTTRSVALFLFGIFATLIIGLRYEVGTDWDNYLAYFNLARTSDFIDTIQASDPGFMAVYWIVTRLGGNIAVANLFFGMIFMVGLTKYCQKQPYPWIGIVIATPFLLIFVAMCLARQTVALGFVLWALTILRRGNEAKFILLILVGALFHKSAAVMLVFALLIQPRIIWWHWAIGIPLMIGVVFVLTSDILAAKFEEYTEGHKDVIGGIVRIWLNIAPSLLTFYYHKRLKAISPDYAVLKWMIVATFICLPLMFIATAGTDRLLIYFTPLQIALWTRLIYLQRDTLTRSIWAISILLMYGIVLWGWLNFSDNSINWVPYKMFGFH